MGHYDQMTGAELNDGAGATICTEQHLQELLTRSNRLHELERPRPLSDWHEDYGPALWWKLPVDEPPFAGTPLDSDWPGYHTHWTPLPTVRETSAT